jgi:hypothetical protein
VEEEDLFDDLDHPGGGAQPPLPEVVINQIMHEGIGAQTLLASEPFGSTVEELRQSYLDAFATSKPNEKNVREDAYWAIRSLQSITTLLEHRVVRAKLVADEVEKENKRDNSK